MKNTIFIASLLAVSFCYANTDSIRTQKISLFDLYIFASSSNYYGWGNTLSSVSRFSPDHNLVFLPAGYGDLRDYLEDYSLSYSLGGTFNIKGSENKFKRKMQPRFQLRYVEREFFKVKAEYSSTHTVDTLKFIDPKYNPVLIDSTYEGFKEFTYDCKLLMLDAGINYNLGTLRHWIFFTGFLFGGGVSFQNNYNETSSTSYRLSDYPNRETSVNKELTSKTITADRQSHYNFMFAIPIGVQHRFHKKRKYSTGFFSEGQVGVDFYKLRSNTVAKFFYTMSFGLRFSMQKHL